MPVFNVEQFLPQCIESILNQTYTNIEILLIGDGSHDGYSEICEEYARLFVPSDKEDALIVIGFLDKEAYRESFFQNLML